MTDMTTTEAAAYLAERGYTVHSKRDGTDKPPNSTTVKQWCLNGRIAARKSGWVWLISRQELDRIIQTNVAPNVAKDRSKNDTKPHQ